MYYCTFWLHRPWQSLSFSCASYTSFLLILLFPSLTRFCPSSLGRFSCTRCSLTDPLSTVFAPGNFSFQIKLHGISRLLSPFPYFLILFLFPDFSFKLSLFEGYKKIRIKNGNF